MYLLFVNEKNFVFWFEIEEIENQTHHTHNATLKDDKKHELKPPRVQKICEIVPNNCHCDVLRHYEQEVTDVPASNVLKFDLEFHHVEDVNIRKDEIET